MTVKRFSALVMSMVKRDTLMLAVLSLVLSGWVVGSLRAESWKVWYDNGTGLRLFHSAMHRWADIPSAPGFQIALVCEDPTPYRRMVRGSDWYWMEGGEISKGVQVGSAPLTKKPTAKGRGGFKIGKTLPDTTFERYRLDALGDKTCSVP